MKLPQEAPRLNPLPFIIADIVLLAIAIMIAIETPAPIAPLPLTAITLCVCLGAMLACLPILLNYTRQRDALLDERQDQIVALTQTAAAAANQLSIASSSLHDIAETSAKMLRHADALPARLQEKIGEFKTQLNEVSIAKNEALEQEINVLRASETERLENALEAIKQFAGEIVARETTAQKQSGDTTDKLAQLHGEIDAAIKSVPAQIASALDAQRGKLEQTLRDSIERHNKELLARFADEIAAIETRLKPQIDKLPAAPPPPASKTPDTPQPQTPPAPPAHIQVQPKNTPKPDDTTVSNTDDTPAATSEPPFKKHIKHPPSSPRLQEKTKPEKTPNTPAKPAEPTAASEQQPPEPSSPADAEPPDPEKKSEATTEPDSSGNPKQPEPPTPEKSSKTEDPPPTQTEAAEETPPAPPPPPPRKRAASKPKPPREEEPMLDLDLPPPENEYSQDEPGDGGFSSALSADGVTRLIVTSYIGIGNKLYIRGDGPGLSWNKGVPLQFVSIGKWRWETNDASAPISFKLYKNDSVECTRIGSPQLEPGHQHEVTADF